MRQHFFRHRLRPIIVETGQIELEAKLPTDFAVEQPVIDIAEFSHVGLRGESRDREVALGGKPLDLPGGELDVGPSHRRTISLISHVDRARVVIGRS